MKTSLAKRILNYLRKNGGYVNGGEIERLALQAGYKASTASRRCREMESGKLSTGKTCLVVLEKKEEKGSVWYKAIGPVKVERMFVVMPDGKRELFKTQKIYQ